jgi:hypothetical protein
VIIVLWLLYNFYYGYNYNKELKESGIVTVGKITEFKGAAKGPYLNFKFFIDGNSYFSDSPRDNNREKIGEFFKVVYSSKNTRPLGYVQRSIAQICNLCLQSEEKRTPTIQKS